MIQVVDGLLQLLFSAYLLLNVLFLLTHFLELFFHVVDSSTGLFAIIVDHEVLLDLFELLALLNRTTMKQTLRVVLVTLASDTDKAVLGLRDFLCCLLVITDEYSAKGLLHGGF